MVRLLFMGETPSNSVLLIRVAPFPKVVLIFPATIGRLLVQSCMEDLQVAGSSPALAPLRKWPWASYLHLRASVTKQHNLILAKAGE